VRPAFVPAGIAPTPATSEAPSPNTQLVLAMVVGEPLGITVELLVIATGKPLHALPNETEGLIVGNNVILRYVN
jgi:hypothetical protein